MRCFGDVRYARFIFLRMHSAEAAAPALLRATRRLHTAVFNGAEDAATALLTGGADFLRVTDCGYTPLHIAAMRGKMRVAAALVRAAMQEDASGGGG
jgi:hypothetical protein